MTTATTYHRVLQHFALAAQSIKYPKATLSDIPGVGTLKLARAGERSRTPGAIQLTDGKPYGQNRWYGRINTDGSLALSHYGERIKDELRDVLDELADDLPGYAAKRGRDTGSCVFCSSPLEDERSLHVGYGPVCAKNYGLPWGAKQDEDVDGPVVTESYITALEAAYRALLAAQDEASTATEAAALKGAVSAAREVYEAAWGRWTEQENLHTSDGACAACEAVVERGSPCVEKGGVA